MYIAKIESKREVFCMVLKSYENKKEEILEYILKENVKPSGIFKVDIFAINEKHKGRIVSTLLFLHPKSKLCEHDGKFYIDKIRHKKNIYKLAVEIINRKYIYIER